MIQNGVSPCLCPAVLVKPGGEAAEGPRAGLLGFPQLFKSSWGQVSREAGERSTVRVWVHAPTGKGRTARRWLSLPFFHQDEASEVKAQ